MLHSMHSEAAFWSGGEERGMKDFDRHWLKLLLHEIRAQGGMGDTISATMNKAITVFLHSTGLRGYHVKM